MEKIINRYQPHHGTVLELSDMDKVTLKTILQEIRKTLLKQNER